MKVAERRLAEMQKDATIIEVLSWLRERLGSAFAITDHWEIDLCAIGISAPADPAQLVYISTWRRPSGYYKVELESASPPGSEMPHEDNGKFDLVSRDELLGIVKTHLRISR
jgi:hypothetical protein